MNNINRYILILIVAVFSFVSCWREDLSDCWKDNVSLIFTVEKFQTDPGGESASNMAELVDYFDYYLFRVEGDTLNPVLDGKIDKENFVGDSYTLEFKELPFGDYIIAAVANNDHGLQNVRDTADIKVEYLEPYDNNDYFVAMKKFTVDCYCNYTDFVKLYNTQGELELRLLNLPENIVRADVTVTNVFGVCKTDTVYSGNKTLQTVAEVTSGSNGDEDGVNKDLKSINMDLYTFPSVGKNQSVVTITLFMDVYGADPVEAATYVVNDVNIIRNQTYRISEDFGGSIISKPDFDISINPDWEGVIGGDGGVEI